MTTVSAFLLFQDSPHTVFCLHSPPGEGSAALGPGFGCYLMNSVVVFLIWNLMLCWYVRLRFLQTFLKWDLDTNMKVCFSHLSQLGIGYWLWCYRDWETWGDDLFVEKWHGKLVSIFYAVTLDLRDTQYNGSSMSFLHFAVMGKGFLLAFPGKQNIYVPRKLGFLLTFCKAVSATHRKWFPKNFEQDIFGCEYHCFPCPQPLRFSWISIFPSCICVCNNVFTLGSFSKPMLTCVCCGLKLSSDVFLSMIS